MTLTTQSVTIPIAYTLTSTFPHISQAASSSTSTSSKSSIFGAAKPREEVLQSKGIDPSAVEKRVEKKANIVRYTGEFFSGSSV